MKVSDRWRRAMSSILSRTGRGVDFPTLMWNLGSFTSVVKDLKTHGFGTQIRHLGQESPGQAEFAVVRLLCINPEGFRCFESCTCGTEVIV